MEAINLGRYSIELKQGDISEQPDVQAVVNAANSLLTVGGGVAGAIHRSAGPELQRACSSYAPISPGQAVITGAYRLPNKYVIHCLGPVYGRDKPEDRRLAECYENALKLCQKHGIKSVAFPAISTGAFGFPAEPAAEIAFNAIIKTMENLKKPPRRVVIALFSNSIYTYYRNQISRMNSYAVSA